MRPFTGVAARAAVWASSQADWSESILPAPLSAGPAAAAAGTGDSANWGEYRLRLERVAAERCLATSDSDDRERLLSLKMTAVVSCPRSLMSVAQLRTCGQSQILPLRCAAVPLSRHPGERCRPSTRGLIFLLSPASISIKRQNPSDPPSWCLSLHPSP
jgi:hypothetical protein